MAAMFSVLYWDLMLEVVQMFVHSMSFQSREGIDPNVALAT